jgi:hypothetical protein
MAALLIAAALGGAGGCGVSSSGGPVDIGDALSVGGGPGNDTVLRPDRPSVADTPEKLVRLYLWAAAGGDTGASARMREFLTTNALKAWREPPPAQSQTLPLTVIRIVGNPLITAPERDRTPVTITYQVVGQLTEQGVVTDLPGDSSVSQVSHSMKFWVVAPERENSLRIDQIEATDAPPGLMISDDALTALYRPQSVYFWDAANTRLIPDLRYLPLTLGPDQRAQKVVQWLLDGPSQWLADPRFTQRLPLGTSIKDGVTRDKSGTWVINLAAPNVTVGDDTVRRLFFQLQWSLRVNSTPSIDLQIEGQHQHIAAQPDDYLHVNESYNLGQVAQQGYDIVEGKVVAVPTSVSQPDMLKAKENVNVAYAAVNRGGDATALVRTGSDGKRFLQIVRGPNGSQVDTKVPRNANMGRPVWIPDKNLVLVASGGILWLVQPNGDVTTITLAGTPGVSFVSLAPDGRRIAWVAAGQAFVAPLMTDGTSVSIGTPRSVLASQLTATAIAWTGEAWLYVVGKAGNAGAMWRTTVDSAVAVSLDLQGAAVPTDLVALATGTPQNWGQVLLYVGALRYSFGTLISEEKFLKNPFFVT